MLSEQQINEILEGCAFLEWYGSLYEYIGHYDGKLNFQSLKDDRIIELNYSQLRNDRNCGIQY